MNQNGEYVSTKSVLPTLSWGFLIEKSRVSTDPTFGDTSLPKPTVDLPLPSQPIFPVTSIGWENLCWISLSAYVIFFYRPKTSNLSHSARVYLNFGFCSLRLK